MMSTFSLGPVTENHWNFFVMMDILGKQPELLRRYKEHLKVPLSIFEHQNITGHTTIGENFKIIGRKGQNMVRVIKEAICSRVNNSTLNRNIGKYNL